jgi:hypothetical protein
VIQPQAGIDGTNCDDPTRRRITVGEGSIVPDTQTVGFRLRDWDRDPIEFAAIINRQQDDDPFTGMDDPNSSIGTNDTVSARIG